MSAKTCRVNTSESEQVVADDRTSDGDYAMTSKVPQVGPGPGKTVEGKGRRRH